MNVEGNSWIKEGHRISVKEVDEPEKFFFVKQNRISQIEITFSKDVASDTEVGPDLIKDLKPGRTDQLFQCIFGINVGVYAYMNLPVRERLHGLDEVPIASSTNREVGHFTEEMSPFENPTQMTEFFLRKGGGFEYPAISVYNPTNKSLRPKFKYVVNRMVLEQITDPDTVDKMKRRQLTYRPITLGPLPTGRLGRG